MNYHLIHDKIIHRGLSRTKSHQEKYERHHIYPKCEGGHFNGSLVYLTTKEHRIIHKIRYRLYGNIGNLLAYNLMKKGRKLQSKVYYKILSSYAHEKFKNRDPVAYKNRQTKSGIIGGNKCRDKMLGFFKLSEEEMQSNRKKGCHTTTTNKLGMFSDEYREKHRLTLFKPIHTPDGTFDNMSDAAKHYNVRPGTITYRVNNKNIKWDQWYYI